MKRNALYTIAMFFSLLFTGATTLFAEKVLVVVEDDFYNSFSFYRMGYTAVNTYVSDLITEGHTVTLALSPMRGNGGSAQQLYDLIAGYYRSSAIDGAVLIGDLPYAECLAGSTPYIADYFFMDICDINNPNNSAYHSSAWPRNGDPDVERFTIYATDNKAEIWVSRITMHNIITTSLKDAYGIPWSPIPIISYYLNRVHQRMTQPETVPQRYFAMGMENIPETNWDNLAETGLNELKNAGYNGWNFKFRGTWDIPIRDPLADMPSNWQAQLQAGPRGNFNGNINSPGDATRGIYGNGHIISSMNSTTYAGIDNFGYEWAGLLEHSTHSHSTFQSDRFTLGTMFSNSDNVWGWGQIQDPYTKVWLYPYDRAYTDFYNDGGHSKTRFFMDAGCSNLAFNNPDCIGLLYGMASNGLICIGSTVGQSNLSFSLIVQYLITNPSASFGLAYKSMVNTKSFNSWTDVPVMIGAGTLKAKAPKGYANHQIRASYSFSTTTVNPTTGFHNGNMLLSSAAVDGGTFTPSATRYKWYGNDRSFVVETGATATWSANIADGNITVSNNLFTGDILIEAWQNGFVSGYMQTSASEIRSASGSFIYKIIVTPANAYPMVNKTRQFSAYATGEAGQPLTFQPAATWSWSVSGGGTISSSGLFTAGNSIAGPCVVTASTLISKLLFKGTGTVFVTGPGCLTYKINCGGSAASPFTADQFYSGGSIVKANYASTRTDATPPDVYLNARSGTTTSTGFKYTMGSLVPSSIYKVRLHFTETKFNAAGARKFNVKISGVQVLTNFDIYSAASGWYKAKIFEGTYSTNSSGQMIIEFIKGIADYPVCCGIEVMKSTVYQINCGGNATGSFSADAFYTSPSITITTNHVITNAISAPAAVYQSCRVGQCIDFPEDLPYLLYTIPGLMPNRSYKIRLHFAGIDPAVTNNWQLQIYINGALQPAVTDPKVMYNALVKELVVTSNSVGTILMKIIDFDYYYSPQCSGIGVLLN